MKYHRHRDSSSLDTGRKPLATVTTSIISGIQILHKEGIFGGQKFYPVVVGCDNGCGIPALFFVTGMLKFTLLMRITGLSDIILPSAGISDLHDWSSVLLGLLVFVHLYLNRVEIMAMTKKVITGKIPGK